MITILRIAVLIAVIGIFVPLFGSPTQTHTQTQAEEGACCLPNANCLVLTENECMSIDGGGWAGLGTDCSDFEEIGTADVCEVRVPKLYWITGQIGRTEVGTLMRANLDGTEIEEFPRYRSVFVDWPAGKLYIGGSGINRLQLNGDLIHTPTTEALVTPTDATVIWVDHALQKLYWGGQGGIFRAGLNIPDGETAQDRTDIEFVVENTSAIWMAIVAPSDDCGRTTTDANHDGDIDLRDYAVFQNCFSGPIQ